MQFKLKKKCFQKFISKFKVQKLTTKKKVNINQQKKGKKSKKSQPIKKTKKFIQKYNQLFNLNLKSQLIRGSFSISEHFVSPQK